MSYSSSTIVKQGYLTKKGAKRKNWTKRWFILKKDKLEYFKNPGVSYLISTRFTKLENIEYKFSKRIIINY